MSPDHFLSEAFGKGSGCTTRGVWLARLGDNHFEQEIGFRHFLVSSGLAVECGGGIIGIPANNVMNFLSLNHELVKEDIRRPCGGRSVVVGGGPWLGKCMCSRSFLVSSRLKWTELQSVRYAFILCILSESV